MPKIDNKAVLLDGKELAEAILLETRKKIIETGLSLGLAEVLVGDDPASAMYARVKEKAADKVGINFHKYLSNSQCYSDLDEYELSELLEFLNRDPQIDGIILQLPLPEGFDQDKMIKLISPAKDVDGFNGGKVIPPTIAAIIELIKATGENLDSKKTLIIGKSDVFTGGIEKYLGQQLKLTDISVAHSIPADCDTYDIIIIALGKAAALQASSVKSGAIVIDVGINKVGDKTVGDVDPGVAEVAGYLSPVPGGVGPLTVACLMRNLVELKLQLES